MTEAETAPYSDSVGAPASDCALDAEPEELRRMYHRAVWDYVTGRTEGIPAHAPASEPAPFSDSVAAPASDCALDADGDVERRLYQRAVWDYVTSRTEGMPAETPAQAPASEPAPFSDSVGASASDCALETVQEDVTGRTEAETQAQAPASEPGHEGYTVWALHNQWEEVEEDSDGEVPGRYQEMFYLADRSLSAAAPAEDMDTAE